MKLALFHRRHKPAKLVKIVEASVFDLDPSKRYVIAFNNQWLTPEERQAFSKILVNKGVKNITCVAGRGDPAENLVVLEQKA